MLVDIETPKNAGKYIVQFVKNTDSIVRFNVRKTYNNISEIIDYVKKNEVIA